MAVIQGNPLVNSARGAVGPVMYRRVGNKTILSAKPSSPRKESEQQRANRQKFKEATSHAKNILKDPQKKAYYQQKAKKLKLPNAYTAAITDYMRKGEIKEISICKGKRGKGDRIRIRAGKKDFAINNVKVRLYDETGAFLFSDVAIRKDHHEFIFPVKERLALHASIKIRVIAEDMFCNNVEKEVYVNDMAAV